MIPLSTKQVLRKLGGDKISRKVYTFDGNLEGKKILDTDFGKLVQISSEGLDLIHANSIMFFRDGDKFSLAVDFNNIDIQSGGGLSAIAFDGTIYFVAFAKEYAESSGFDAGVYIVYHSDTHYATKVEFAETIHPIDPKFLSGVCLPVVELTAELVEDTPVELNDTKNAILTKAAADKVPVIIVFQLSMGETSANIANIAPLLEVDGIPSYGCTVFQNGLELASDGAGKWTVTLVQIN